MSEQYFSTKEVAEIFKVSIETVRQWRDREPLCPSSPLRLVGEGTANSYRYTAEQLHAFAIANPKYLDRWIASAFPGQSVYCTTIIQQGIHP